jgi:protein LTV1
MPLGVLESKPKSEKQLNKIEHNIIRILPDIQERKPDETKEEKKARKNAIKEHKRERRVEKKMNKLAFKTEKAAQTKILKNETTNYVKLF